MSTTLPPPEKPLETAEQRKERLAAVLAQLDAAGRRFAAHSTFLDLCELAVMLAPRVGGMMKWSHERVTVHIKQARMLRKASR